MSMSFSRCPIPLTYRELWLPETIRGTQLPAFRGDAHGQTLTGAKKGTTVDGVYNGELAVAAVGFGIIFDSQPKFVGSRRFKLKQPFAAGAAAPIYLWDKVINGNNYAQLRFVTASGKLNWHHIEGGVEQFSLLSAETSWNANQWYHVIFSMGQAVIGGAPSDGARLRIDNGVAVTDPNIAVLPATGAVNIGGLQVLSDYFVMTDDVTEIEETELYRGIPPADAVNACPFDEGRGLTAYDRGTGVNNGTLVATTIWEFGQVKQPVLSLDSINDRGQSSSGVKIHAPVTVVLVIKAKSTYTTLGADRYLLHCVVDASNEIRIYYATASNAIVFHAEGTGTAQTVNFTTRPIIDDYLILIMTVDLSGNLKAFVNGSLIGTAAGVGAISGAAATMYLGCNSTPASYDISKPLFLALIEGAFTAKQALIYSRWLRDTMNLPISI